MIWEGAGEKSNLWQIVILKMNKHEHKWFENSSLFQRDSVDGKINYIYLEFILV